MALRIVWRNSISPNFGRIPVERIADDEFGTRYEVRRQERTLVLEVTYGCKSSRCRRRPAHRVSESA